MQNILVVVASFVFYGWWDWRFLSLLIFSSVVDYFVGIRLGKTENERSRKYLLVISLFVNLGLLGFFKYYNFFVESFAASFEFFGEPISVRTLSIVLPVGISFYTFQTLSYSIDCYRRKIEPTKDFISFVAFVSFFPQLVAGPIERASHLLPQFYTKRVFSYDSAVSGLQLILWGMLKKVVVADTCASNVNYIFDNYQTLNANVLFLGIIHFAFQIYCDFSGYSDIAIGTSRLFGFDLMRNFAFPYFSRDIAEFWRRWHISLTTWFRDYLYIPLGGSRGSTGTVIRNIFIIFLVSGFWHGANWTFVVWGAINAVYFLPLLLLKRNRDNLDTVGGDRWLPTLKQMGQMLVTFLLTLLAWTFFRADNVSQALDYLKHMVNINFFDFSILYLRGRGISDSLLQGSVSIVILLLIEWTYRHKMCPIEFTNLPKWIRWTFYWALCFALFFFGGKEQTFIYFQF